MFLLLTRADGSFFRFHVCPGEVLGGSWGVRGGLGALLERLGRISWESTDICKNHRKITIWRSHGGVLGGVPGRSWGALGASWGLLGALWGLLGPSWSVLRASWSVLKASWGVLGRLGAVWGPSGGRLGAVLGRCWLIWGPQVSCSTGTLMGAERVRFPPFQLPPDKASPLLNSIAQRSFRHMGQHGKRKERDSKGAGLSLLFLYLEDQLGLMWGAAYDSIRESI